MADTPTEDRARRIKKKYRKLRCVQTGRGIMVDLAKLGITMGSKAINSVLGKKLIDKGIEQVSNLYRYETSKIKNTNIQQALNSDIVNYAGRNRTRQKIN